MYSSTRNLTASLALALTGLILFHSNIFSDEPPRTDHGNGTMTHSMSKEGPQVTVKVLRADEYAEKLGGTKSIATMVEVTIDPLGGSPPHRHPGPVSGYVLEGTFEFQVEGGPVIILKAGDTFFEPTMILHKRGHNPDKQKRTRVLATIVHPANSESIMIMEPEHK